MAETGFEMTEEETKQMTEGPAEPAATPEPAAATPPETVPEPAPHVEKTVPLAALIEAREEAKIFKRQLKELEDFKNQFLTFRQQQQVTAPPPPPIPAFDDDPLTHTRERLNQVNNQVNAVQQTQQYILQQQAVEHQKAQLKQQIESKEAEFRSTKSDYDQAINFLTNFRKQELAELGVTDPIQINQVLAQNALGLWHQATVAGKNPPEVVYALAQRYGYKPAQPVAASPVVAQAQQKIESRQEADLKAIEKGQQAATKTLSGAGKTTNDTDISIQAMLEANDADFDRMWKEKFKNAK